MNRNKTLFSALAGLVALLAALLVAAGDARTGATPTRPFFFVDRFPEALLPGGPGWVWEPAPGESDPGRLELVDMQRVLPARAETIFEVSVPTPVVHVLAVEVIPEAAADRAGPDAAAPLERLALEIARKREDLDVSHRYRIVDVPLLEAGPDGGVRYGTTFNTAPDETIFRVRALPKIAVKVREASVRPAHRTADLRDFGGFRGFAGNPLAYPWRRYLALDGDLKKCLLFPGPALAAFRVQVPRGAVLEGSYAVVARNGLRGRAAFRVDFLPEGGGAPLSVMSGEVGPGAADVGRWNPFSVPLSHLEDRRGTIVLRAAAPGGGRPLLAWGAPILFGGARQRRRNLLVITVDSLSAGRMSEAGTGRDTTPFLSALSRKGLYVPTFVTHFGTTYFSLMSMLQSRRDVAEAFERQSPTLMGELKASGYLTGILGDFETGSGLAGIVDSFRLATDRPSDRVLLNRGLDIMRRHRDAPFALWMHLDGPHIQTELEPAYQNLFADNAALPSRYPDLRRTPIWKERIELLASERERVVLDYDRRLRQTDDLLREFWAAAEKEGLFGNTLVVVSADHGEDLFTHHPSFRGHGTLYDTVMRVPLIWVDPGGSRGGGRLNRAVPAVDLAPSILTALGIAVPEQFEGRSFLPYADGARAPRDFLLGRQPCTNGMVYALRSDRHKLIWSPSGCQPSYPEGYTYAAGGELYDLLLDPEEHRNLIAVEPELADHLRRQVRELTAAPPRDARGRLALEQKLQDVLRMAGYVR